MTKKKFNIKRFILVIILLILIIVLLTLGIFFFNLRRVSKNSKEIEFTVSSGSGAYEILENLEKENIIRSAFALKIYDKLRKGTQIEAGVYILNQNMTAIEIYKELEKGAQEKNVVSITFKEGSNVRDLANLLEENEVITKEELMSTLKNTEYLDTLIEKFWFLTDEIKKDGIYYTLEGYFYPNTYLFYKDSTPEEVIEKFLEETDLELTKVKSEIETSGYTVHELLTLSSIVELESYNNEDRLDIAGVFKNRLNDDMPLESCVSTYYAYDINMGERELSTDEIYDCSTLYNTRCQEFIGLPVGPIGNPSLDSINAALHPSTHDYYYFLSDINLKTYFSKTYSEHIEKQKELESEGLWLNYDE